MQFKINIQECISCGCCIPYCPVEAIGLDDAEEYYVINNDICNECGICLELCAASAVVTEE